jgi:hypothetical protein
MQPTTNPVGPRARRGASALVALAAAALTTAPSALVAPPAAVAQSATAALGYSTFVGGTQWDEALDVEVDRRGNTYVAGFTFSPEFPRAGTGASSAESRTHS